MIGSRRSFFSWRSDSIRFPGVNTPPSTAFAVTTRSYDNTRAGANASEAQLTPAAVRTRGIRKLFTLELPGDARGCEAQPLIVPAVTLADGTVHDVVYVATMANQVFAFDANDGSRLWMVTLGTPIKGDRSIDEFLINDHWGIMSTPVIDLGAGLLYLCAWVSADGSPQSGQHIVHALRLEDGTDARPPINLEGVSYDPGHGQPVQYFRSAERKQRAALLLVNRAVVIGFGTVAETAASARGWLIAVDMDRFEVAAAWASCARGSGGGIWHSGAGPAADTAGNIYVLTGNGDFDARTDFGESIVKLEYTPPTAQAAGSLRAVDWWTPWTDDGRTGGNAEGETADHALPGRPTNFRKDAHLARSLGPDAAANFGAWGDQDFGSAGPVLAPAQGVVLASNKDGILYTARMQNLGRTQPGDLEPANTAGNYAKLRVPPIYYTYYPGPLTAAPANVTDLNFWGANRTHHLHGTPVLWQSAAHGWVHYCWGENGNLRAWSLASAGESTYLACSAEVASAEAAIPLGGMPGGMITLSANGMADGVIWASIPYGDANSSVSAGRFLAYDAAAFGRYADGSGSIPVLWDSQAWAWQFSHNKFNRPVVWNGKIFLPTYDGSVWVLGLA